jgi:phosphoglycerate kinase
MFEINFLNPKAVEDKVIIIRLDLNVPFSENEIKEATRINESIPTLKYLLKNKAKKIHILSHLGRPKGEINKKYSLRIVLQKLSKKLGTKIEFRDDFTSGQSRVQLHENVRFFPGEKNNDPNFILNILKEIKPDIFIQDGQEKFETIPEPSTAPSPSS